MMGAAYLEGRKGTLSEPIRGSTGAPKRAQRGTMIERVTSHEHGGATTRAQEDERDTVGKARPGRTRSSSRVLQLHGDDMHFAHRQKQCYLGRT